MSVPDERELDQLEWLETNQLGSFAMACVDRKLRRKYHALLTVRDPGRGDPWNLLAETYETLRVGDASALLVDPLSAAPDAPRVGFRAAPHAAHDYRALGIDVQRTVRLGRRDQVEIRYQLRNVRAPVRLSIEPLLRCRPLHDLTQENPFFDGTCVKLGEEVRMMPYAGMPAIALRVYGAQASFEEQGRWLEAGYVWEAARGYPASESLFSPGRFSIALERDAELTFVVGLHRVEPPERADAGVSAAETPSPLARAAAQFFATSVSRQHALVAGYPWFGVRSRDALIALPGAYLATGSWERAEAVLASLAASRVRGLVPTAPAFAGAQAETSSVEASLLYVRAVQWFAAELGPERVAPFMPVVCELIESLAEGNDPRARFERGVSIYGEPGPYALTWMDAVCDGRPVTPRAGYAVELDALAYNAVRFACAWADDHRPGFARIFRNRLRNAEGTFVARYWDDARGYLADAHDGEQPDVRLRPNQLWALALPYRPISNVIAHAVLRAVTRALWTPLGLRTLTPHDLDYRGRYLGGPAQRERTHHQGSVFPWLTGLYAEATLTTLGPAQGYAAALEHIVPILERATLHLQHEGCIGHISELFDGDAPHRAGGAPAQAVSATELFRAERLLDAAARSQHLEPSVRPGAPKRSAHESQHGRETISK